MRRNVSIVLILLCVCSVYLFSTYILTPASENNRESLAEKYKMLQQYETVVRGAGTTEDEIKALNTDMKDIEKRLIAEKSDFLSAAKMQREISELTSKSGLNVATIRPLGAVKLNAYTGIPVYFEGNGNIQQLSNFLKLIESNQLMLKIDKLSLNITNLQKTDDLKFKIQISGLSKI